VASIDDDDATSIGDLQAAAASACPAPLPARKDYGNGDPDAPYNPPGARNTDSCLALNPAGEVDHDYTTKGPAAGDVVFRWIHGSVCAAKNTDPRIQVVAYNEDTYILRENPCVNWEAPFVYLLFGNHGALLIDTGATPEAKLLSVARDRGPTRSSLVRDSQEEERAAYGGADFGGRRGAEPGNWAVRRS
jgi:hypothetical protein